MLTKLTRETSARYMKAALSPFKEKFGGILDTIDRLANTAEREVTAASELSTSRVE